MTTSPEPPPAASASTLALWWARLRDGVRFARAPLKGYSQAELVAVEWARRETNLRRMQLLTPFSLVVQSVACWNTLHAQTHSLGEAQWRHGLLTIQSVALPFTLVNVFVTLHPRGTAFARYRASIGDVAWCFYVFLGAAMSVNAQRFQGGFSAYVACLLLGASYFMVRGWVLALGTLGSLAVFLVGVRLYQPVASLRTTLTSVALQFAVVSTGLARMALGTMAREVTAKLALQSAKRELERLNASLEQRVEAQVGEMRARAREVEALNARLDAEVRARSRELSDALARLAETSTKKLELRAGDVLGDRFVVRSLLGMGGMGAVFLGTDRVADAEVAIKVLHASSASGTHELQRFLREGELLARVRHPAVVRTLHVGLTENGRIFLVLELVRGRTLQDCITRGERLGAGELARVGAALAGGLTATHAAEVVHRDIKPANVMVTADEPGVKIFDFGIARPENSASAGATHTGEILGTPAFMAPEQFEDFRSVQAAADVYALGAVLFCAATGRGPFVANSPGEWLRKHATDEPDDPRSLVPALDEQLAELLLRCLRKGPSERPTARELGEQLVRIADRLDAPASREIAAQALERIERRAAMVETAGPQPQLSLTSPPARS